MSKLNFMCKTGGVPLSGSRTSTRPKQTVGVMWNFVYTHCGFVHLFILYTTGGALRGYGNVLGKKLGKLRKRTTTLSEERSESECEVWLVKSDQDISLTVHHEMFARRGCTTRGMEMLFLWGSKTTAAFQVFSKRVFGSKQPFEQTSTVRTSLSITRVLSWEHFVLRRVCACSCVLWPRVLLTYSHAIAAVWERGRLSVHICECPPCLYYFGWLR